MNITEIERLIENFSALTGMDILLVDSKFRTLAFDNSHTLQWCNAIHTVEETKDTCMSSDIAALRQVEQIRDLYFYKCAFGVTSAVCPIFDRDAIDGYLVVTIGFDPDTDERAMINSARHTAPALSYNTLAHGISLTGKKQKRDFAACEQIIRIICRYIEDNRLLSELNQSVPGLIKQYIDRNIAQKITLADISLQLHYSAVTLTEQFRRAYGMSIMTYVMKERLRMAEKLLIRDNMTVGDVAEACGFSDAAYFSRCFSSEHKVSPKKWKEREKRKKMEVNNSNIDAE